MRQSSGIRQYPPEFLKNIGPRARKSLAIFLTRIILEKNLRKSWRITKTVAIPKPGKDPKMPSSYRPIYLLSMCYQRLERINLHRISPAVDEILNIEQAGFRPGRSTQDQVLALTTYVENGYQRRNKTGVVFLDLTDCCIRHCMAQKLSKVLPCWAVSVIDHSWNNGDFVSTWVTSAVIGGCRRMACHCHKDLFLHRLSSTCTSMICQPLRAGSSFMPTTSALPTRYARLKI